MPPALNTAVNPVAALVNLAAPFEGLNVTSGESCRLTTRSRSAQRQSDGPVLNHQEQQESDAFSLQWSHQALHVEFWPMAPPLTTENIKE